VLALLYKLPVVEQGGWAKNATRSRPTAIASFAGVTATACVPALPRTD